MFKEKQVQEVVSKKIIAARYGKKAIEELIRKDAEAQGLKLTSLQWGAGVKDSSGQGMWGEVTQITINAQAKELPKKPDHRAANDGGSSLIHIANPETSADKKQKSNKSKSKKK